MSADQQAMIDQLMAQQTMTPQPSFAGLSAPPDQGQVQALLGKLRQQQFQQQALTADPLKFIQASQIGVGQGLGNMLTAPGGVAQSAQPQQAQSAIGQAINQAKQAYTALINANVDPDKAELTVLKMLQSAGVPGADQKLAEAQEKLLGNNFKKSETDKDTAQAAMDNDEINNRAKQRALDQTKFDQGTQKDTWTTVGQGNGYAVQRNGLGEMRSTKISDASAAAASGIDPAALQRMVDEKLTTGKDPSGLSKAGLLVPYQNALAARLQQTGDTQGAANARSVALKSAAKTDQVLGQQYANTQSAGLQIEKNIDALKPIVDKLGGPGSPLLQKAVNQFNQGLVGDKDTAQAVFYINELQNELAKISSNSFGNQQLSDSAKADAKDLISKSMIGTGSLDGVFMASRRSYLNKLDSLGESRNNNRQYLSTNAPGSPFTPPQGAPPAQPAATAPKALNYNPASGKFE